MKEEIIIAGFGGQGVLSMGKILAYSGLMENKEVTWMPAYGPEQRGGTANVTVIVSDERISSPIFCISSSLISSLKKTVIPTVDSAFRTIYCTLAIKPKNIQNRKIHAEIIATDASENQIFRMILRMPSLVQ